MLKNLLRAKVGRTPWSARDPLIALSTNKISSGDVGTGRAKAGPLWPLNTLPEPL